MKINVGARLAIAQSLTSDPQYITTREELSSREEPSSNEQPRSSNNRSPIASPSGWDDDALLDLIEENQNSATNEISVEQLQANAAALDKFLCCISTTGTQQKLLSDRERDPVKRCELLLRNEDRSITVDHCQLGLFSAEIGSTYSFPAIATAETEYM